jgi:hypothetical protein
MSQMLIKNRQFLQRGYTRSVVLNSFSTTFNTETDLTATGNISPDAFTRLRFRLNLLANFATKWDRTSFAIGTRGIAYGHNPRVDNFLRFDPAISRTDLGFNNDMGVFFRAPMNHKFDLDASLTLGGFLKIPPLFTRDLQDTTGAAFFGWTKEKYKGTFLMSARIGTPTFRRQEFGLFGGAGHIVSPFIADQLEMMVRIGADYSYKIRDGFKITQQVSFGPYRSTDAEDPTSFSILHAHTSMDALFFGRILFTSTHSFRLKMEDGKNNKNGTTVATLGYVFNPNTQLRINGLMDFSLEPSKPVTYGTFVQLIAGIGQR